MNSEFTITRIFNAPQDQMFKLWTEAEHLANWYGPKGFKVTKTSMDARPGGVFHFAFAPPNGDEIWARLTFSEVSPNDRLMWVQSFSDESGEICRFPLVADWPLEMQTTVTFHPEDEGRTRVSICTVPHNANDVEIQVFVDEMPGMNAGWTGSFEKLDDYIASIN